MFSKFFRFSANAAINTAHISIKSLILVSIFLKGYAISIIRFAEENKTKSVSKINRVFGQKITKMQKGVGTGPL